MALRARVAHLRLLVQQLLHPEEASAPQVEVDLELLVELELFDVTDANVDHITNLSLTGLLIALMLALAVAHKVILDIGP